MQEEEKNNGMEGMSVEEMFLGVQESYQEAQLRAQEENRAFARTEFFRMDKFGTYRLRILPIAPNPDGSPTRPGYEYPVHQLLLELEKPATGNKPQKMYVTVTRATDIQKLPPVLPGREYVHFQPQMTPTSHIRSRPATTR